MPGADLQGIGIECRSAPLPPFDVVNRARRGLERVGSWMGAEPFLFHVKQRPRACPGPPLRRVPSLTKRP